MSTRIKSLLILVLAVVAGGSIVYGAMQYQKNQTQKSSVLAAQQEIVTLLTQVGKLIELPKGETPTIATVTDIKKLQGQSFFSNAKNGDKVFIYTNARKAILYRPSTNKIIEVGPVNIQATPVVSPITAQNIKIALYNGAGTKSAELVNTIAAQIKNKFSNAAITTQQNAASSGYVKNLVVDLSGKYKDTAQQLGSLLHARVTTQLPSNEVKPADADILIIVGTAK